MQLFSTCKFVNTYVVGSGGGGGGGGGGAKSGVKRVRV